MLDQDGPELLPLLRVKCQILRRALADVPGLQLVGPIDTATPLSHLRLAADVAQVDINPQTPTVQLPINNVFDVV